jgi:hypothetical protein
MSSAIYSLTTVLSQAAIPGPSHIVLEALGSIMNLLPTAFWMNGSAFKDAATFLMMRHYSIRIYVRNTD